MYRSKKIFKSTDPVKDLVLPFSCILILSKDRVLDLSRPQTEPLKLFEILVHEKVWYHHLVVKMILYISYVV